MLFSLGCSRQRASKAIPQGEFVSVTSFDGHRVYLKLRVDEDLEKEVKSKLIFPFFSKNGKGIMLCTYFSIISLK